jgi:hypothetical protein
MRRDRIRVEAIPEIASTGVPAFDSAEINCSIRLLKLSFKSRPQKPTRAFEIAYSWISINRRNR